MNIMEESVDNKLKTSEDFDLILRQNNESIVRYFKNAINLGLESKTFDLFDNYLINCLKSGVNIETNVIFSRILSLCSQLNLLCTESDSKAFKQSRDDFDSNLSKICCLFENFDFNSGLKCLKDLRNSYGIGNKDITIFYDSSVKILIKNCVKTVFESIVLEDSSKVIAGNEWVVAKSPARIDLQGGWTDTPPICYELGGRVINIAVQVNNGKPVGARARKVGFSGDCEPREATPLISIREYDFNRKLLTDLKLNDIKELSDYSEPDSPGAIIKSALICCQIIDTKNHRSSLREQLESTLQSGLEIELWSDLPQGSGLGTSSILSGCVVAVLWLLLGKKFSKTSLINAVLYVEQLMSTGGGWQDQVGGIVGGIKLGHSLNSLPLKIGYEVIEISDSFASYLSEHLVLIYSGSVRLAKNLLQNVIQNWYLRDQQITDAFNQLLSDSEILLKAILNEEIKTIGTSLSKYWELKKILAPNSEPKQVSLFLKRVEPLICGGSLCGAGGGGFMALIAKEPTLRQQIISLTELYLPESQVYDCLIDQKGLQLFVDDIEWQIPE